MAWAAFSKTWKSPLIFIGKNVKINAKHYVANVLKPISLLLNDHYKDKNWTFQQDRATSHTAKISQNFCKENFRNFWSKDMWPPCSPNLNPMDFSVWGILQKRACQKKHHSVESLNYSVESLIRDLLKEWEKFPQDMLRAANENAIKRMRIVCDADG